MKAGFTDTLMYGALDIATGSDETATAHVYREMDLLCITSAPILPTMAATPRSRIFSSIHKQLMRLGLLPTNLRVSHGTWEAFIGTGWWRVSDVLAKPEDYRSLHAQA